MNDLRSRTITSLVAVAILIPALVWAPFGVWLFCIIVSTSAVIEFFNLMGTHVRRYRLAGILVNLIFWSTALFEIFPVKAWGFDHKIYWLELVLLLPFLQLVMLYDPAERRPVQQLGRIAVAFIYIVLPLYLFFDLSVPGQVSEYSFHFPLGFLLLTWALDVSAYFMGRFFGKNLLFERISPKKTWEGAIGGGIFCLLWGWVNTQILPLEQGNWMIIAAIIAVFSQLGDLTESMLKRSVKAKDSGGILPGHGGMLDRFDGTFLSIPLVYFYFSLL